jgi:hypothetical protein
VERIIKKFGLERNPPTPLPDGGFRECLPNYR